MTIQGKEDLAGLRAIGRIVARCLRKMGKEMKPGMTTRELDDIGREFLESEGARSAPVITYDFPGWTCISVNEEVAHGIPGDRVLSLGDMVHVDVSAEKDGFFGDTGSCFVLGPPSALQQRLTAATRRALRAAMSKARAGQPMRGLGKAMEREATRSGFEVIRNLGSHGIGRALHEEPKYVPGYDEPGEQRILNEGLVLTLEPFLTTGGSEARQAADGWTLCNDPGSWTAQFEHTIVITDGKPQVMTLP